MLRPKYLLLLVLLIPVISSDEASNKTIRIGYLVSYFDYAGAINVAIRNAQNDGLLRDYNFRYNFCTRLIYRVQLKVGHELISEHVWSSLKSALSAAALQQ